MNPKTLFLVTMVALGVAVGVRLLFFSARGQQPLKFSKGRSANSDRSGLLEWPGSRRSPAPKPTPRSKDYPKVSPRLWKKLVKLTRNEDTAQRLVRNLMIRHPDRSADWCCDKAIYDLERDRYRR